MVAFSWFHGVHWIQDREWCESISVIVGEIKIKGDLKQDAKKGATRCTNCGKETMIYLYILKTDYQ